MSGVLGALADAAEEWIYATHVRLAEPLKTRQLRAAEQPQVRSYCETLMTISSIAADLGQEELSRLAWEFYEHWKFYTLYAFNFEHPWLCAAQAPLPRELIDLWIERAAERHAIDWATVADSRLLAIHAASHLERAAAGRSFSWRLDVDLPDTTIQLLLDEDGLDQTEIGALVELMSLRLSDRPLSSFVEMLDAA